MLAIVHVAEVVVAEIVVTAGHVMTNLLFDGHLIGVRGFVANVALVLIVRTILVLMLIMIMQMMMMMIVDHGAGAAVLIGRVFMYSQHAQVDVGRVRTHWHIRHGRGGTIVHVQLIGKLRGLVGDHMRAAHGAHVVGGGVEVADRLYVIVAVFGVYGREYDAGRFGGRYFVSSSSPNATTVGEQREKAT